MKGRKEEGRQEGEEEGKRGKEKEKRERKYKKEKKALNKLRGNKDRKEGEFDITESIIVLRWRKRWNITKSEH